MLFRTVTSVAILAFSASVNAKPQPYKLAVMPLPGLSLGRRDTSGYMPEETVCGEGNTCEEACGGGFLQCPSNDAAAHCFNPDAGQNCCTDGTGNSCESGYYCTHDNSLQTWCCPDSMDLAECAAAYSVTGGLETAASTTSTTSSAVSTTSSVAPTTTSVVSSSTPIETSTSTPWTTPSSSWTPSSTFYTANSTTITFTTPTVSTTGSDSTAPGETTTSAEEPSATGAAALSGVSFSLLIAAAGVVALF